MTRVGSRNEVRATTETREEIQTYSIENKLCGDPNVYDPDLKLESEKEGD